LENDDKKVKRVKMKRAVGGWWEFSTCVGSRLIGGAQRLFLWIGFRRAIELLDCWTAGLLDYWTIGLLDYWTTGLLDYWIAIGLLQVLPNERMLTGE
jgi:hypothetical protein